MYGVNKFASNVEQMTGMLPNRYWVICWGVVAPLVMGVIFLFYCIKVNIIVIILISDLWENFSVTVGARQVRKCRVSPVGAHCWVCDLCLLDDVDSWLRSLLSLQNEGVTEGAAAEGGDP